MRTPMDYAADFSLDDLDRPQAKPLTPEQIDESLANWNAMYDSMVDPAYVDAVMRGGIELLREQAESFAASKRSAA